MVAEVGTSKLGGGDPGLHNKPLGCGASEVYASGPDCEEEEDTMIAYPQATIHLTLSSRSL